MANTFINRISGSIGTAETTIYTTPALTTTTVIGVSVSNRLQSNILVDVSLSDGSNTAYLCTGSLIPPGSNIILVGGEQKVVMQTGNTLKLRSNTAGSADIIVSALEIS